MKLPRNGSPLANAMLIAVGVAFGASVAWWMKPSRVATEPSAGAGNDRPVRTVTRARDPQRRLIAAKPPGEMDAMGRSRFFREEGGRAAGENLRDALAAADAIPSAADRADYLRGVYGTWAEDDPEGALGSALASMPAGELQSDAVGIAINKWGRANPREAWLWAEANLSGPLKERALTDVVIGWTRRSPQEAADWLASTGLTSQPLYNALPRTWAETDPDGALAWVDSLPDGKARNIAELGAADPLMRNDPAGGAEKLEDRVVKGDNPGLPIVIADIWGTTDPAATAGWIDGLPDGPGKSEAAATLATVWAASDIHAAVAWTTRISDPDMLHQVVTNIGTTWGAIEPYDALQWLGSLPANVAGDGITGAYYSWAGTDPVGMREWIDQAPAGTAADRARQSLGDVLSQEMMPDAMELALGMDSKAARDDTLARYFREWRKRDDASARDWWDANQAGLPETARTTLEKVLARSFEPKTAR